MQCADITELLLDEQRGMLAEVDGHVAGCQRCAHVAAGLRRLDAVLTTSVVIEPPLELQRQLAQLARDNTVPQAAWWTWTRLTSGLRAFNPAAWLEQRPQVVAAQGLAAVMLTLASWQIFGWVSAFQPVVGDVAYAMELVIASPASVYLGGLQIDLQSLGLWSLVGIGGWLISENGVIGQRLTNRLRLP